MRCVITSEKNLPEPTARFLSSEGSPEDFGEAGIRGMLCNPVYAGVGAPALVDEQQWIASANKQIEEDGPEQFLVNMLFVMRQTISHDPQPDIRPTKSKVNPCVVGIGPHPETMSDADWIKQACDWMFRNGVEKFFQRMLEELRHSLGGEAKTSE